MRWTGAIETKILFRQYFSAFSSNCDRFALRRPMLFFVTIHTSLSGSGLSTTFLLDVKTSSGLFSFLLRVIMLGAVKWIPPGPELQSFS
jgi:hypothetical protein